MSLLELAADCQDVAFAFSVIKERLKIKDEETALRLMPDQRDWQHMRKSQRLQALGSWLQGECFHVIETQLEAAQ